MCSESRVVNLFNPIVLLLYTILGVLNNFFKFNDFKKLDNNGGGEEREMNKT